MLKLQDRISAWTNVGNELRSFFNTDQNSQNEWQQGLQRIVNTAVHHNGWFEKEQVEFALRSWADALSAESLQSWLSAYSENDLSPNSQKSVGIVMAGNIPLVGLHDLLSVTISGHKALVKLSSDDNKLIPHLLQPLGSLQESIEIVERLNAMEAVIATGSDNTARYFEHYFGKYPNIIRKNRKSVAILDGSETEEEIVALGEDVFRYFGMGCRSVSKLYLPKEFDLDRLFGGWMPFQEVVQNNKYANNYDYHRALFLLDREAFLENGFVVLREHERYATPVSIVHYERYSNIKDVEAALESDRDKLQCVVGKLENNQLPMVAFGQTQSPALSDYADGVDTMKFLIGLS